MIYINAFLLLCILLNIVFQKEKKYVRCYVVDLKSYYRTLKGGMYLLAEVGGISAFNYCISVAQPGQNILPVSSLSRFGYGPTYSS